MTRLYVAAATCCMATALISPEVDAQQYSFKLERPTSLGSSSVLFVAEAWSASSVNCTDPVTYKSKVGTVKGYRGNGACARFGIPLTDKNKLGVKYGSFKCSATTLDFTYKEYFNEACLPSTVSNAPLYDPKECVDLDESDENEEPITHMCTHADAALGSILITSSRYSGRDDCANGKNPIGQDDMIFIGAEETTCVKMNGKNVWYLNACPTEGKKLVTTLYSDATCVTELEYSVINADQELKSVYSALIEVGNCDDNFSNYDTCTLLDANTVQPTNSPTNVPTLPKPTKSPTLTPPTNYPSKTPSKSPSTVSPTNKPSVKAPTAAPVKRPTRNDNAASAQGVAGDVLLALAAATLALGVMV